MQDRVWTIGRRQWGQILAGAALGGGSARAAGAKDTLTIGLNIADTVSFDPARAINYTPPLTLAACYDTLVTMRSGHYDAIVPRLATAWEMLPDGTGWRFTLRPGIHFASGRPVTAEDWRFSFERLLALGDQPAQFVADIARVETPAPDLLDLQLRSPNAALPNVLAAVNFCVLDRQALAAQGGTDLPNARQADMATAWLNQHSAGSGPYMLDRWVRNERIELSSNPNAWDGVPAYQRIVLRHIPDSTAQFRAIQRGDIDAAFNLLPEQIGTLRFDDKMRIESTTSLDFVYLALNGNPALNKALAVRQARQAVACAIDYDGLIERLLGGKAVRPASFLPVGVCGSTPAIAYELAPRQNLDQARRLLQEAGFADGFAFDLAYADTAIAGVQYGAIAKRLRDDLGRVGITATLRATEPTLLRDQFLGGKAQAALTFWNAPVVDNRLWARATIDRLAQRVDFAPPAEMARFVDRAAAEADPAQQQALWVDYQRAMIYRANLLVLFQPIYQVAVRRTVATLPLTAAGWMAELREARPAP